jgi:hypothetical protein
MKSAAERSQRLSRSSGLILVKHETESMSGTSITGRYITVTIAIVMRAPQMLIASKPTSKPTVYASLLHLKVRQKLLSTIQLRIFLVDRRLYKRSGTSKKRNTL